MVTGRGADGRTRTRTFGAAGGAPLGDWVASGDGMSGWSDKALGDTPSGGSLVAVAVGPDTSPVLQRGSSFTGLSARYTSAPDVATRPDGTFLVVGRGRDGALWLYDGRPGRWAETSLGGTVG